MEPLPDDDFELLRAWQAGDARAGTALVRRHFTTVYRFFRNKVEESPKDLVQRTFQTCVEILDRVPDGTSFRSYVLGIARNLVLHHWRGRARERAAMQRAAIERRETPGSPSWAVALAQEQRLLLAALRRLPLDLQITIELHYFEELAIEDVARIVGAPAGTVKSRLHRARGLLRKHIEELATSDAVRRTTVEGLEGWARSLRRVIAAPEPTAEPGSTERDPSRS